MANILIVDDHETNRNVLNDFVSALGHVPILAEDGLSAMEKMKKQPVDVVLLDILMPEMDGYKVLNCMKVNKRLRNIPVIMISVVEEMESIVRCIKKGADDYLTKPFEPTLLKARIEACLKKKRLHDTEHELLENTLGGSIKVLTDILAIVNPTAFGRAARIKRYVRCMVEYYALPDSWQYDVAAMLSQIGCVTLPQDIIGKIYARQVLTTKEQDMYSSHPSIGRDLVSKIPRLENISSMIALQQKSNFGPNASEEPGQRDIVILGGQMLKVAIVYDSLIINGASHDEAVDTLQKQPDEYDPPLVLALSTLPDIHVEMKLTSVSIDKLDTSMILDEDVMKDDVLLVDKGTELTPAVIERLHHFVGEKQAAELIRVLVPR
ncbi:MAG: response regulator [Candidatus Anammoxibacter sp.]